MTAKSIPFVLLIACSLAGTARAAAAQLRICNTSAETVSAAVAYRDQLPGAPVVSRGRSCDGNEVGWHVDAPGQHDRPLDGVDFVT
jgi:uncharacterized membrane protein